MKHTNHICTDITCPKCKARYGPRSAGERDTLVSTLDGVGTIGTCVMCNTSMVIFVALDMRRAVFELLTFPADLEKATALNQLAEEGKEITPADLVRCAVE